MNVSNKTHYALRILVDLALFSAGQPARVADMAERQGIPRQFLHQILLGLKSSGMVRSVRGRQGGYMLAAPSGEITVASAVRAMQGDLFALPRRKPAGGNGADAAVREVWDRIRREVKEELESMRISDLCKRAAQITETSDYMI